MTKTRAYLWILPVWLLWAGCVTSPGGPAPHARFGARASVVASLPSQGVGGGLPEAANNPGARHHLDGAPVGELDGSSSEALLAPFLACASPVEFVELQRGVDMARLVERLDDWSAVRLGAQGPLLPEALAALNRKRASFLVATTQAYGVALAEVFALFVLHSASDEELKDVLHQLARDKRLGQTLGQMAVAREQLRRRGLALSEYPDRPEHTWEDGMRGAREGMGDVMSAIPLFEQEGDYLRVEFKAAFSSQAGLESWNELDPFLRALEQYSDGWMPDVVDGKRQRRYSRASLEKALEERRDENSTALGLYRTNSPALDGRLWLWLPPHSPELDISLKVKPLSFFSGAERCHQLVEMMRAWACRYLVSHASAHSVDDKELAGSPRFGREMQASIRAGFDKIYEVFWLNVFGPKLVETVGRERMLSTPAWRVEELPNGSVLLVTWPTAADFASEEARVAQARAHVHLRPDLDFETVLGTLRERSAKLAPVEPRFPPDVAPLLTRVVDSLASLKRPRQIADLNAWQPPEPEEWLPADAALPVDVEESERVLARYGLLSEQLVAMLHTQVPSVFQAEPGSLTDIDFYLWREDFPRTRSREALDMHVVPAMGAYLGEVLVHHLGGEWIPRRKLGEAQVRVGDRVWLPMVRAHRALRSRQALLDSSLTQLYRDAERHRAP